MARVVVPVDGDFAPFEKKLAEIEERVKKLSLVSGESSDINRRDGEREVITGIDDTGKSKPSPAQIQSAIRDASEPSPERAMADIGSKLDVAINWLQQIAGLLNNRDAGG